MRIGVLETRRAVLARSAALAALTIFAAGCSADVARFDDGFYTGAVPQASPTQMAAAQPYPGSVDGMNTGSINASGPSYGGVQSYPGATAPISSNPLPPPSSYPSSSAESQSYGQPSVPSYGQPSAALGGQETSVRGAAPSTLQEQAARINPPASRPGSPTASSGTTSDGSAGSVTVESGDTLLSIARRTGASVADIKRVNGLTSDTIRLGQTLRLPSGASAPSPTQTASLDANISSTQTRTVSDTTSGPSSQPAPTSTPNTTAASPAPGGSDAAEKSSRPSAADEGNSITSGKSGRPSATDSANTQEAALAAPQATGISQFRWPVQGRVIKRFGEKVDGRRNDGLNISVPRGTPVKAAENGVVIYAGDGLKEFGNTVLVKHENGLVTVYGHADELNVERGDTVKRGQEIAKSGMSGDTSVPVLHFEVRKDSAPVDPTKYLQ